MDESISDQQELLLLKACERGGTFSMELARKLYSSKSSAQSAVQKLELLGYIKNTAPGAFKVEKITPDVRERYQEKRGDQGSSESSFVKEPASP